MTTSKRSRHGSERGRGSGRKERRLSDTDIMLWATAALSALALGWGLGWEDFQWALYAGAIIVMVLALLDLYAWLLRDEQLSPLVLVWVALPAVEVVWLLINERYLMALLLLTIPPWLTLLVQLAGRLRIIWFRHAAKRGHTRAQFRLGEMLYFGDGVREDVQQALHWYHQAAQKRYRPAERRIARIYETGDGVPRNQQLADEWYLRADRRPSRSGCGQGGGFPAMDTVP